MENQVSLAVQRQRATRKAAAIFLAPVIILLIVEWDIGE